tara:strand:+ start:10181 stop:11212 length:1032 start_codon:yes stop_codon:yes gene_type:complete
MIVIKNIIISFTIVLLFQNCMEPNHDNLWSISINSVMQTNGFARDVTLHGDNAIVAAGQSGIQVWNLNSSSLVSSFLGYEEGGTFLEFDDLAVIGKDMENNLIFVSESNEDVKIFHYNEDSIIYRNTIMSARTKDFVVFPSNIDQFVMYTADNDDGMKWHYYNLDSTTSFGIDFIEWTPFGGSEIYTPGKPLGIDSDGYENIVMAVDQLGVELYSIDSLGADPVFVGRVDTEGNAEKVSLTTYGVFVACDNAGASYIPKESFNNSKELVRFATDFTVDHIAVNNSIAALSIGSKGIALYDISNPESPVEKGVFPIGYSYMSLFWDDELLVCTREGLQRISINK